VLPVVGVAAANFVQWVQMRLPRHPLPRNDPPQRIVAFPPLLEHAEEVPPPVEVVIHDGRYNILQEISPFVLPEEQLGQVNHLRYRHYEGLNMPHGINDLRNPDAPLRRGSRIREPHLPWTPGS